LTSPRMKFDDGCGSDCVSLYECPSATSPVRSSARPVVTPATRRLSNNAINFIVDVILLLAFVLVLTVTAIVQFLLPDTPAAAGWTLWSLDRMVWQRILAGSIAMFGLLVLLHLILHWSWVCSFVSSRLSKVLGRPVSMNESTKTIWGVATLIFILTCIGTVLLVAEFSVVTRP
jgi:hypothetical protein